MRKSITLLIFSILSVVYAYAGATPIVVVIDAGHGGSDPGHEAHFSGHSDEKVLNLKIAQYLGGYLEKYLQNVKVVYTRTDDSFISLDDRVNKANGINADYFLSIHCNGNENRMIHGTESHIHTMESKKALTLAKLIEKQFSSRAGRHSRGVKTKDDLQHSLQVLKFTKMTSVLVECGFLSNKKDADFLNGTYGQEIVASAIFRAFRTFLQEEHPGVNFTKSTTNTTSSSSNSAESGTYSIQIASSKTPLDVNGDQFKKAGKPVKRIELTTTSAYKYIYVVGSYTSVEAAKSDLNTLKANGFRDAIVRKNE